MSSNSPTSPHGHRVAAIYDIHGNLPALEAVIADVRRAGADLVVMGGDVLPGPMARESLAYLRALDLPLLGIMGNGDREVLARRRGETNDAVPEVARPALEWCADQIDDEDAAQIAGWPATTTVTIDGLGDVCFCHATPRDDNEIFTRLTDADRLRPIVEAPGTPVVVCGHTHMQFDRMVGATRVVNAGSVGMPFQDAGAYWVLLGPGVELRRTAYDLDAAAARISATAYPGAGEFATRHVRHPPSEADMLAALGRAELR
ncbi:MAG: metallophosphoesterase family protein [Vicinamibacterales bacterium]